VVVRVYAAQRKPVASGRGASGLAGRPPGDGDHSLKSDRAAIASGVQRWLDGLPL
jgi:hypothetical protein